MIKPLGNRVLVKPSAEEEKSAGGIILPDKAQKKPTEGRVISAGPGKVLEDGTRAELCVKVDDLVVYTQYAGTEVKIDGDDYVLIEDSQLLAVRE